MAIGSQAQGSVVRRGIALSIGIALAGCVGQSAGPSDADLNFVAGETVEVVTLAPPPPVGECVRAPQVAWVTAVAPITVFSAQNFSEGKAGLACEIAEREVRRDGAERCAVQYDSAGLYRNGRLLPLARIGAQCRCWESNNRTRCELSVTAECGYETQRSTMVEICG